MPPWGHAQSSVPSAFAAKTIRALFTRHLSLREVGTRWLPAGSVVTKHGAALPVPPQWAQVTVGAKEATGRWRCCGRFARAHPVVYT
jgi:hypothetical protein